MTPPDAYAMKHEFHFAVLLDVCGLFGIDFFNVF